MDVFVLAVVVALIVIVVGAVKQWTCRTGLKRVPGLKPTTKKVGNLPALAKAGSLQEFLLELHEQYGQIASFWMGETFVVSISSPDLFKQQLGVFDRPPHLFKMFEPVIGPKSIQYANGPAGKKRRTTYDRSFSYENLRTYYDKIQSAADDIAKKWEATSTGQQIPIGEHMFMFAIMWVLRALMGNFFNDEQQVLTFKRAYNAAWSYMEGRLAETGPPDPNSESWKQFQTAYNIFRNVVTDAIAYRRKHSSESGDYLLCDNILDYAGDDEEMVINDTITFITGGFHTTGNLLTWAMYYLAREPELQEKLNKEIEAVLSPNELVNEHNINDLKYVRQVIDETLRCAVIAPYAARFQHDDMKLGGYIIPKGTPVIHALGARFQDKQAWPNPGKFDPERFSPENTKKHHALAFSPFGFAGKRMCPGYKVAYMGATICLTTLLRKFDVKLVEGQTVVPEFGFVCHPREEIWVTISKR